MRGGVIKFMIWRPEVLLVLPCAVDTFVVEVLPGCGADGAVEKSSSGRGEDLSLFGDVEVVRSARVKDPLQ